MTEKWAQPPKEDESRVRDTYVFNIDPHVELGCYVLLALALLSGGLSWRLGADAGLPTTFLLVAFASPLLVCVDPGSLSKRRARVLGATLLLIVIGIIAVAS